MLRRRLPGKGSLFRFREFLPTTKLGFGQEAYQFADFLAVEPTQQLFRSLLNYPIQLGQDFSSLRGNVRPYDSTVVLIALLAEEFLRFQAGEQTGDVWLGSDHHVADGGTGESVGICAAQNAQSVVLRSCEAEGFEPLLKGAM